MERWYNIRTSKTRNSWSFIFKEVVVNLKNTEMLAEMSNQIITFSTIGEMPLYEKMHVTTNKAVNF